MMEPKLLPLGSTFADITRAMILVKDFKPRTQDLPRIKRCDWVRLLLEFNASWGRSHEFLTCMVENRTQNGLIRLKILSNPAYTSEHGLTYGDIISVSEASIIEHDSVTQDQAHNSEHLLNDEDQKLQAAGQRAASFAQNLQPIPPQVGGQYWTRNGLVAEIWTRLETGQLLGKAGEYRDLKWNPTGAHESDRNYDIVKDPSQSEVL